MAVARWKVPDGMSSEVHEWDPRTAGGSGSPSPTTPSPAADAGRGKSSGGTDTYSGRFVELVPDALVAESIEFETDRPDLRGQMSVRTTLRPAPGGTEVLIAHEGLPAGVDPADNETGTAMSLAKLAGLLEAGRSAS